MKPQTYRRRLATVNQITPYFTNTVRAIGLANVEQWASVRARKAVLRVLSASPNILVVRSDMLSPHPC